MDYRHGTIVTVSRITTTAGTKRWLGEVINATAIDTASHGVAIVATAAGVPWEVVTSILDDRDFNAPKIVDRLGSGPNERGLAAYVNDVSKTPQDLPTLIRLGRSAATASSSLTTFMAAFMEAHSALTRVEQITESE